MSTAAQVIRSFLSPKWVEHEVNGELIKFWPIRPRTLNEIRPVAKPIAKALSAFLAAAPAERKTIRDAKDAKTGMTSNVTEFDELSPETLSFLAGERDRKIEGLIDALFGNECSVALGLMISDSARDLFPEGRLKQDKALALVQDDMDLPTLIAMIIGVVRASKEMVSPLVQALPKPIRDAIASMVEATKQRMTAAGESSDYSVSSKTENTGNS